MPRARMTEQERREKALMRAIARGKVDEGLFYDKDVAHAAGIDESTYFYQKKKYFQGMKFASFAALARTLKFTGREVCACIGVPYDDPEE